MIKLNLFDFLLLSLYKAQKKCPEHPSRKHSLDSCLTLQPLKDGLEGKLEKLIFKHRGEDKDLKHEETRHQWKKQNYFKETIRSLVCSFPAEEILIKLNKLF